MSTPEVDVGGGTVSPNVVAGTVRSRSSMAGSPTDTGGPPQQSAIPWLDEQGVFHKLTPAELAKLDPTLRPIYEATLALQPNQQTKPIDPDVVRGTQAYVDIWGIDPPKDYIKSLVHSGMNPYEIRAHELSKLGPDGQPLAKTGNYWRDQEATYASVASQVFARR